MSQCQTVIQASDALVQKDRTETRTKALSNAKEFLDKWNLTATHMGFMEYGNYVFVEVCDVGITVDKDNAVGFAFSEYGPCRRHYASRDSAIHTLAGLIKKAQRKRNGLLSFMRSKNKPAAGIRFKYKHITLDENSI